MDINNFDEIIKPFIWVDHDDYSSIILNEIGEFKQEIFDSRQDEGCEGSGYDWEYLCEVFLAEKLPELQNAIRFDPESSLFCAYSEDKNSLKTFILKFREALEDTNTMIDLLSRADLD